MKATTSGKPFGLKKTHEEKESDEQPEHFARPVRPPRGPAGDEERLRLPKKCSIGSARSTPSKKRFAGDIQTNAAPSARNAAARRSMRCALGCSRRRSRSHANPRLPKQSSLRSIAGRRCAAFARTAASRLIKTPSNARCGALWPARQRQSQRPQPRSVSTRGTRA